MIFIPFNLSFTNQSDNIKNWWYFLHCFLTNKYFESLYTWLMIIGLLKEADFKIKKQKNIAFEHHH